MLRQVICTKGALGGNVTSYRDDLIYRSQTNQYIRRKLVNPLAAVPTDQKKYNC